MKRPAGGLGERVWTQNAEHSRYLSSVFLDVFRDY
jgi:hypothetical protein